MENFFTNRHGGLSHGDFSSFNLALHVGDEAAMVQLNRAKLVEQVGQIAVMSQVHGDTIIEIDHVSESAPTADALITSNPEIALVVMVADCIPLLLRAKHLVAAVHVGRAGLLNAIALKTIARMRSLGAQEITGMIGPAICGNCYEVPADLHDFVVAAHPTASSRTKIGTPALDLPQALIADLATVDVQVLNSQICTFENDNYFSYRRNNVTGRQAGIIKL